jgi:hypothetical protein
LCVEGKVEAEIKRFRILVSPPKEGLFVYFTSTRFAHLFMTPDVAVKYCKQSGGPKISSQIIVDNKWQYD